MALNPTDLKKTDKPTDPSASGKSAGPSAEDEILMREIDEAVRKDNAEQFARKYGLPIAGLLAVVLAGLGFYLLYWVPSQEGKLERQSESIIQALDASEQDDFDTAAKAVSGLTDSQDAGARTSARFIMAGVALEKQQFADAVKIYRQIAEDPQAPQALRDLARIREVTTNYDDRKPADIIARLKDLAVPGNPYFGSAGELVAVAHLEAGNRKEAGAMFSAMAKDEGVPETLRTRARQMAGLLGVDAIEDVEQLLEDEGVTASQGDGEAAATGTAGEQ